MSDTVSRSITTPSADFNKEDKGGDEGVSYRFGKRQSKGGVTYTFGKLPHGSAPGNAHTQSKDAGIGGKKYKGHGGSGYPAHGKFD